MVLKTKKGYTDIIDEALSVGAEGFEPPTLCL